MWFVFSLEENEGNEQDDIFLTIPLFSLVVDVVLKPSGYDPQVFRSFCHYAGLISGSNQKESYRSNRDMYMLNQDDMC